MTALPLEIETNDGIAHVWLNRPDVRNAMDEHTIGALTDTFRALDHDDSVRVVVLGGRGKAFCAGGDLNWMRRMASFGPDENKADSMRLATMLRSLAQLSKPTIARVHGPAYAGGLGLTSACDLVVAATTADFCLSEVRLGLVPATISPYVMRALGARAARRYMLTAERFSAAEAFRLGLVHELCPAENIDAAVASLAGHLKTGGPQALAGTKRLMAEVEGRAIDDSLVEHTAEVIAKVRTSDEAQEGIAAFFEKRRSVWNA